MVQEGLKSLVDWPGLKDGGCGPGSSLLGFRSFAISETDGSLTGALIMRIMNDGWQNPMALTLS